MINYRHAFAKDILANGFSCPDFPIDDGVFHRFHIAGDKPGSKNGWYVLHGGAAPAGAYGSWRAGITITWRAHSDTPPTSEEREAAYRLIESARRKRREEQQRRQEEAAETANQIWSSAPPADPGHPYLQAKRVKPYSLRQTGETLLVPLYAKGQLVNLQRINPEGDKRFLYGGQVTGVYYSIRGPQDQLFICEGVATAHTVHALMGVSVVAAMNCGNLEPVARYFDQRYPDLLIAIAADNDRRADGNPGIRKGTEAAAAVGGLLTWPHFPEGTTGTDFNDLANLGSEVAL